MLLRVKFIETSFLCYTCIYVSQPTKDLCLLAFEIAKLAMPYVFHLIEVSISRQYYLQTRMFRNLHVRNRFCDI